jgi:hypothetical protein
LQFRQSRALRKGCATMTQTGETNKQLGRLQRIDDLRNQWPTEAEDFTPWLSRPENLELLGETLGIELELEAQEKPVGPFRADMG